MSYSGSLVKMSLLREVQAHIQKLEGAIAGINSARKHLKQSSMEVKTDIQTTMTHQLEALRERELYLLRQVDVTEQMKDASLQDQEDQLHEALGELSNILQMQQSQENTTQHVTETLDRLKKLDLNPKETPCLAFKANLSTINDCINDFGHIDIQKMPLGTLFGEGPSATSLPRAFEDYDDEDHHVLYRSITDPNLNAKQVSVTIPSLSKKPEDWLLMPSDKLQAQSISSSALQNAGTMKFPPFMSNTLVGWLDGHDEMNRSVSSAASIHQWLCDIQGQGDVEEPEAQFEVISPSPIPPESSTKGSSIEIISMEEVEPIFFSCPVVNPTLSEVLPPENKCLLPYFKEVTTEPTGRWLLTSGSEESSASYCNEVLSYFRESSKDTKDWLIQYTEKNKESRPECVPTSCCAATTRSVDIENLDKLVCVRDPVTFFDLTSDPKSWLLGGHKDEDMDLDEAEGGNQALMSVCKANEPCDSFQMCLADENCCSTLKDRDMASDYFKADSDYFKVDSNYFKADSDYFEAVKRQEKQMWLLPGNRVETNEEDVFQPFYDSTENEIWLLTNAASPNRIQECQMAVFAMFDDVKQSAVDQWVVPSRTSSVNDLNRQDLTKDWASMFQHQTPKTNSIKKSNVEKPRAAVDTAEWLFCKDKILSETGGTLNITDEDVNTQRSKTISWLLKSEQDVQENYNKENRVFGFGKQAELPECEDEPSSESHPLSNVFLSCFQTKPVDNGVWLAYSSNELVD